jgi:anti-sigma regulatory factor (Ser/Thr protein kinase)
VKILSSVEYGSFKGRDRERARLLGAAGDSGAHGRLLLLAEPGSGATELLRQVFDSLFNEERGVIPIYFSFGYNGESAANAARRFVRDFARQSLTFLTRDASILSTIFDAGELGRIAEQSNVEWLSSVLINEVDTSSKFRLQSFIRTALSSPFRGATAGLRFFVMFDALQCVEGNAGELNFAGELADIYRQSPVNFVLAGRRRFIARKFAHINADRLTLGMPDAQAAAAIAEALCTEHSVGISAEVRDLLVCQTGGIPRYINELITAAEGRPLLTYVDLIRLYADAVFGGRISRACDELFKGIAVPVQRRIITLLSAEERKLSETEWEAKLDLPSDEFEAVVTTLDDNEIIRRNAGMIDAGSVNIVFADYSGARFCLENLNFPRARVVADFVTDALERSPHLMKSEFRRRAALGIRSLLSAFNGQQIPAGLIDYSTFKEKMKDSDAVLLDANVISLPQIVFSASVAAIYPASLQISDEDRAAFATGFNSPEYVEENKIVLIAAEIDSKLECGRELAEFWCDRLEMAAAAAGDSPATQLWIIAPEGFTDDACIMLRERRAWGSSRRQFELLKDFIGRKATETAGDGDFYEIIVPMGDSNEMLAAGTVESIARVYGFSQAARNQIKTAMVEAFINAAEHSLSPDRKVYHGINFRDGKLTITIQNRGIRIPAEALASRESGEGRRGWGIGLMKRLMDEISFEPVDEGTRIVMTKFLK